MCWVLPKRQHSIVPCPASIYNPVWEKKQHIFSQNKSILVIKMRVLSWQSLTVTLFFAGVRTEELSGGMKASSEDGSQVFTGTLSTTGQAEGVWKLNMLLMSRTALMCSCYIEWKSPGRSGINHPCPMFDVLESRNWKRISKKRILTQWQEHFSNCGTPSLRLALKWDTEH